MFDLLYLNGQSLIHKPLSFRKRNLRQCVTEIKGRIEYVDEYRGKTPKDIRSKMDEVMATRGEGLIIKHPLSKYVLNGRNMDWIKVGATRFHERLRDTRQLNKCLGQTRIYGISFVSSFHHFLHNVFVQDNMGETADVLVVGK